MKIIRYINRERVSGNRLPPLEIVNPGVVRIIGSMLRKGD